MKAPKPPERTSERERFLRRAQEARTYVARVDPALLDQTGLDLTLHELTLARSVMQRLDDAYRHELGNAWLRERGNVGRASGRR